MVLNIRYSPESVNVTRASIHKIGLVTKNSIKIKEQADKRNNDDIVQVDTYRANIISNNKIYNVNLIVKK